MDEVCFVCQYNRYFRKRMGRGRVGGKEGTETEGEIDRQTDRDRETETDGQRERE